MKGVILKNTFLLFKRNIMEEMKSGDYEINAGFREWKSKYWRLC